MGYFYIELEGDVEQQCENKVAFTLLASYREDKQATVVKAHAESESFAETLYELYSDIAQINRIEWLSTDT